MAINIKRSFSVPHTVACALHRFTHEVGTIIIPTLQIWETEARGFLFLLLSNLPRSQSW